MQTTKLLELIRTTIRYTDRSSLDHAGPSHVFGPVRQLILRLHAHSRGRAPHEQRRERPPVISLLDDSPTATRAESANFHSGLYLSTSTQVRVIARTHPRNNGGLTRAKSPRSVELYRRSRNNTKRTVGARCRPRSSHVARDFSEQNFFPSASVIVARRRTFPLHCLRRGLSWWVTVLRARCGMRRV